MLKKVVFSQNFLILIALFLGVATGMTNHEDLLNSAKVVSDLAIRLMKLVALPLLFLSIVSSATHFKSFDQLKKLGIQILRYTVFTTLAAALVAEALFFILGPYILGAKLNGIPTTVKNNTSFFETLISMIPDNVTRAFLENNVMAVVLMAITLAVSLLGIKQHEKDIVFTFFSGLLDAMMRIVHAGLKLIPIAVWAFVAILTQQIAFYDDAESLNAIGGLTLTVIAANLLQGTLIIPLLLWYKKINPLSLFLNVKNALLVGFFARSSMAALPITLDHAVKDARIDEDTARLSLPLCTTINMNGCAQFILLSVYFVCAFTGNPLSAWEHVGMVFLSITAAIGNAGVPMGCFFLASSILASKDIPLHLMYSILPLYAFIDMVETAINVWSDVSITKIVAKEKQA